MHWIKKEHFQINIFIKRPQFSPSTGALKLFLSFHSYDPSTCFDVDLNSLITFSLAVENNILNFHVNIFVLQALLLICEIDRY